VKQIDIARIARALAFPALVYLMHLVLAKATNYYIEFPWVDMPMHFVGGAAIAYGIDVLLAGNSRVRTPYLITLLVASVAAALLWELGEFTQDQLRDGNSQVGVKNTLRDIFFGALGSATYVSLLAFKQRLSKGRTGAR
jgi:hypothetical protein